MATRKLFVPPNLNCIEEFEDWLHETEIWQCLTDLEKNKQGPAIYLSLDEKIRKTCSDIKVKDLNSDDGVNILINKLKSLFAKDSNQAAYLAYDKFETFKRPVDMNIVDFINEFERLYNNIKKYDMELPTGVLAYRLLKSADISEDKQQLARATLPEFSYECMKRQLKAIYDNLSSQEISSTPVKVEPAYEARGYNRSGKDGYYSRGQGSNSFYGGRGRARFNRGGSQQNTDWRNQPSEFRKQNPINNFSGKISRCAVCQSIYHWAKDCPHNESNKNQENKVTLFTQEVQKCFIENFLGETLNLAVLDSGCTKTVCGEQWLNCYIDSLSETEKKTMKRFKSNTEFRFGDGKSVISEQCVSIPCKIAGVSVNVETDVVKSEIPLLLSKESMKKAGTKIDFVKDKINIFGKEIDLKFTSSGHYAIPLNEYQKSSELTIEEQKFTEILLTIDNIEKKSEKEKQQIAVKLHKQFGHPKSSRLIDLIKTSGITDKNFIDIVKELDEKCDICLRYKKPKSRPVVGFSLAHDFNETVAMDLKPFRNVYIFHMIDHATRYSGGAIIHSKQKEVIIDKIFKHWISIFGTPKLFLSDNGGEFNNDIFREMGEQLNINVKTTSAESPWSNGIVEKHNGVIGNMMEKVLSDVGCSLEVALAWCLSAKNALLNAYGYSPNQLVFGYNPNFPSVIENKLPALEGVTSSKMIASHLNALHSARKRFIETEADEKLRRALRHKTRTSTSITFQTGDQVYYKKKDSSYWKGPGTVIGYDNKQVFVRHGGSIYRVSPCNLQLINKSENNENRSDEIINDVIANENQENEDSDLDDIMIELKKEIPQSQENSLETNANVVDELADMINQIDLDTDDEKNRNPTKLTGEIPSLKSKITYEDPDTKEWRKAMIISRAGKASGRNKYWLNVKDLEDDTMKSVDFENIRSWKNLNEEVLLCKSETFEIVEAKLRELENLKKNKVYNEVEDEGQSQVSVRWVITEKTVEGVVRTKARLVARGFEEIDSHCIRKDSPTCGKENLRLVFVFISMYDWKINTIDIRAAFLQGNPIEREVYLKPPKEAQTKKLWKLNTTIYGLGDAPRAWYLCVKDELLKIGGKKSKFDNAIFFWHLNDKLQGILSLHVDDFCWAGTEWFRQKVIDHLRKKFLISKEETETFKYLGLQIMQNKDEIKIHQKDYIGEIQKIEVDNPSQKDRKLSTQETQQLRRVAGQLNWVSTQTRPDMAYAASIVSGSIKDATVRDLISANKYIKMLQSTDVVLSFPKIADIEHSELICYSDASFANLKCGGSQGGIIVFIQGTNGKYMPLAWQSRKLKRVVKSTLTAETLALQEVIDLAFTIKCMLLEISNLSMQNQILPIKCIVDSKSLYDAVYSSNNPAEKRLKVELCSIRESLEKGEIQSVKWVVSKDQLADCLTKEGASKEKLYDVLNGKIKLY